MMIPTLPPARPLRSRSRFGVSPRFWIFAAALVAGVVPAAKSQSTTLVDPPPVQIVGAGSLNPAAKSLGWFSGADASLLAALKADPEFASVQTFTGFTGNAASGKSYVLSYPGARAALRFAYETKVATASAASTNNLYATSTGDGALRIQAAAADSTVVLAIRFGSWDGAAAGFAADQTARAVGFILSGNYGNLLGDRAVVAYYSATGVPLSVQSFVHAGSTSSSAGANQPLSAFTGWNNTSGDETRNVGYVTVSYVSDSGAGPWILALDDFGYAPAGAPGRATRVFADTFRNGSPQDSDSIPGFWSVQTPQDSTVVESDGALRATSVSSTADTLRTTLVSPALSGFNFFERQLRFGVGCDVTGDVAVSWMGRGRLILAPSGMDGRAAPSSLLVGYRTADTTALTRKLDGPGVEADSGSSPKVARLIGTSTEETVLVSGSRYELTLNAESYRLKLFDGGQGSGVVRFTGKHGIPRARWGVDGNSSLILETLRTGSEPGEFARTTWRNLTVDTDTAAWPDEPSIPFEATYATSGASETKKFSLWLPAGEPTIRGIIFVGAGSGGDFRYMTNDLAAQEAARALGFGIIGYASNGNINLWSNNQTLIRNSIQAVLDAAAEVSGRPEIVNAPLCITGFSAGGFDASYLAAYWPERTIAFVGHRGGAFPSTGLSTAARFVPGLFIAGSEDTNIITYPANLKSSVFQRWRSANAQVAFAVDWGVPHLPRGNQGWEAGFSWLVEVAALRWPRPAAPSSTPGVLPTLTKLGDATAWLGDNASFSAGTTPSVTSPFTPIAPFAYYTGTVSTASWLPNEACARMYRAFTSTDLVNRAQVPLQGALRIAAPAQFADAIPFGGAVTLVADAREFETRGIVSVEFREGATLLGSVASGTPWSLTYTPGSAGLKTIEVVATDAAGNQRSAFRAFSVAPAAPSALSPLQAWRVTNGLPADGTGDGADTADPDGDGVPNLLEFATGVASIHAPARAPAIASLNANGRLRLAFDRLHPAPAAYHVEASSDLSEWTTLASLATGAGAWAGPGASLVEETGEGGLRSIVATDAVSTGPAVRRFLRLRVVNE